MAVPSTITDLSENAASNSPAGSDSIGTNADNFIRAQGAILRQETAGDYNDVASAATVDLGAEATRHIRITGTTTITGFGTVAAGVEREVRFAGALTLTHNGTSLILPGAANITTAANDCLTAVSLGSGNWIVTMYQKATGYAPLVSPALTGTPTAPTAAAGTNTTQIATTAFVAANTAHKTGSFDRDISTASGTQAITGLGFTPRSIEFKAAVGATVQASWGSSDGTTHKCISSNYNGNAGQFASNDAAIFIYVDASNYYSGVVSALGADGFTITWTKTGSPTGTARISYTAHR